ncbi:MAG TPA: tetratricopeptide repeat protein, partial [Balneolales bacterium]|nr:tetratricopeptide repeat protein [Balneolales bacterium]
QLNSTVIDVPSRDLAQLQNSSVTKLLNMLNIELNPSLTETIRKGGTTVPGAYESYLQGIAYLRRYEDETNVDSAIKLFQEAIKADSAYALAYAALGESYWRKYELDKDSRYVPMAKMACVKALKINNELAPVNVTMGLIALGTGQYNESAVFLNQALEIDPKDASAYRGLAKAYEARGLLDRAESTYKQAIRLKPDYWAGYNDLGVFYYRHSRYEKAIDQFKQVIQMTPDNYRGYSNLGGIYYLLQRWQPARDMFEHSLALKKTYDAASNLGTLDFIQGKYSTASRMYETALQLNQNDYNVWGNLAASYYWTPGERDKAGPTYEKAIHMAEDYLKINPKNPVVLAKLAGFYAETGDTSKSMEYLTRSLKLGEKDSYVMFCAGATYEKLGKRDEAFLWIEKALKNGYSKSEIINQPELKSLITEQRFKEMIKRYK